MFLDFALLTEQQGELIDQIEFNVKSAVDYVEDANVDVYDAIESSKKVRKKQWCVRIGGIRWKHCVSSGGIFLFVHIFSLYSVHFHLLHYYHILVQLDYRHCNCSYNYSPFFSRNSAINIIFPSSHLKFYVGTKEGSTSISIT